jgi:hypothetical protein
VDAVDAGLVKVVAVDKAQREPNSLLPLLITNASMLPVTSTSASPTAGPSSADGHLRYATVFHTRLFLRLFLQVLLRPPVSVLEAARCRGVCSLARVFGGVMHIVERGAK